MPFITCIFLTAVTYPEMIDSDWATPWYCHLAKRSLHDLIAIYLPHMLIAAILAISACYVLDRTMKMLLFSALPVRYQNWFTMGVCLLEEVRFLGVFLATVMTVWQTKIVAFDLINNNLELIVKSLQTSGGAGTADAYPRLRCIQLYVNLVNVVNCYLIFAWKIQSLGMSITCGYAAIAHFKDHPVFGVMYYLMLLDAALIYMLLYEKAFKVPELFNRAKPLLRLRGNRVRNGLQRKVMSRQAMSIQPVGIKVGEFHTLERLSSPIFLHYVLTNVVGMLVAYG